jgi:aryl-alcohol dehydrogenase-like predicted oxidoreductase
LKKILRDKIIVGTRSLSGDMGSVNQKEIRSIIEQSISCGLNHFDTAPFYGNEYIDNILKNYKKDIIVDTKCGYDKKYKIKTFNIDDIKYSLDSSLKKFGKINIFYIHNPRNEIKNWNNIFKLLLSFKKDNLVKYLGISIARDYIFNFNILNFFDFIQDDINILRNDPLKYLKNYKGSIYARSPFASGCLSGKLNYKSRFNSKDYRYNWLKKDRLGSIIKQIEQIKKIYKGDIKELAINYLIKKKEIKKIIIGLKKMKHLFFLKKLELRLEYSYIKKIDELNRMGFYLDFDEQGY